jgi:hypothetical protein
MVLLKNDGNVLPLDKQKIKTVLMVGPDAYPRGTGGSRQRSCGAIRGRQPTAGNQQLSWIIRKCFLRSGTAQCGCCAFKFSNLSVAPAEASAMAPSGRTALYTVAFDVNQHRFSRRV